MRWGITKTSKELKEIEKGTPVQSDPVSVEDLEKTIKLIETAKEVDCRFQVCFTLAIGEYFIDSDAFRGIKFLKKTKNEEDRVMVSQYNALLSTDTIIKVSDIIGVCVTIKFKDKE